MTWDLVADIGGTNTRLARVVDGQVTDLTTFATNSVGGIRGAFETFLSQATRPNCCAIAIAAPVEEGRAQMTNSDECITHAEISHLTGAHQVILLNDFEAAAWSLLTVQRQDVVRIQGPGSFRVGNRLVVGPGTGLGVGLLAYSSDKVMVVPGEGGHVCISPVSKFEVEVFEAFRKLWPDVFFGDSLAVEAEAFLSGTGLPILHQAVCAAQGEPMFPRCIKDLLSETGRTEAAATLSVFCSHLGRLCGDFAVALSAVGGVFLTGGVACKNPWLFNDEFLSAFNSGGRFTRHRQDIGIYLSRAESSGLTGARNVVAEQFANRSTNTGGFDLV